MTSDGWIKLIDEMRVGGDDLYESIKLFMPTADLYGMATIDGVELVAFNCHQSEVYSNWPSNVPLPEIIWSPDIYEYIDRISLIDQTKYFECPDEELPERAIDYHNGKALIWEDLSVRPKWVKIARSE